VLAAQAEADGLRRALQEQRQARAAFEQLAADLANQVQALQAKNAALEAEKAAFSADPQLEPAPSKRAAVPTPAALPLAASAVVLALAGGGVAARRLGRPHGLGAPK
jgi:hypothetical protein